MQLEAYKVSFRSYTNGLRDTVARNRDGQTTYLNLTKDVTTMADGFLVVITDDISSLTPRLNEFGNGIRTIEYIGKAVGVLQNPAAFTSL